MFVVAQPDVYRSDNNSFIVFGEAKVEDLKAKDSSLAAEQAAQGGGRPNRNVDPNALRPQPTASAPIPAPAASAAADEEPVDESGVDSKDIELVVSQAGCSRAAAVKALKNNDNDIVNAIMELTM